MLVKIVAGTVVAPSDARNGQEGRCRVVGQLVRQGEQVMTEYRWGRLARQIIVRNRRQFPWRAGWRFTRAYLLGLLAAYLLILIFTNL